MKEGQASNQFSCFPTIKEEGDSTFADFADEEDTFSDEEDTLSESDPEEFEFELQTPSEVDAEEDAKDRTTFASIHSISMEKGSIFSAWRPYIPPEPVF